MSVRLLLSWIISININFWLFYAFSICTAELYFWTWLHIAYIFLLQFLLYSRFFNYFCRNWFMEEYFWYLLYSFKKNNPLPFYVNIVCIVVCVQSPMSSSQFYLRNIYFTVYFGRMLYWEKNRFLYEKHSLSLKRPLSGRATCVVSYSNISFDFVCMQWFVNRDIL